MRVLITGKSGQLARALFAHLPQAIGVGRPEVDLARLESVQAAVEAARPELIIHCAAMTDVDGAARDPHAAYVANGLGTQNVALAAEHVGAALAYISTNEVFDGAKTTPYTEFDTPNPINPYGWSKRAGEWFVQNLSRQFFIIRTSWVTGHGGRNFVHRIQQLADERGALKVVANEVACPTFTEDLANAVVKLVNTRQYGLYHCTNSGYCSRFEYAKKILELSGRAHIPVEPITLADFPRPSTPPPFTPLANFAAAALGITLPPWELALEEFLRHP
ncbi:MAG: dTDP-4-dehydrorhamnose reductase [Anaerolineales bacterium]|nr:dTDP-4-dehydrorhamnose reductase [Anaerolineales bacterium]